MSKMYIAVLNEVPDFMVPTLVAHSVLSAHVKLQVYIDYIDWFDNHFKKVVLKVNRKEFNKICALNIPMHLGHELHTLNGEKSCAVILPLEDNIPNVLKFAKMWKPGEMAERFIAAVC